jgi:hypothetical protein
MQTSVSIYVVPHGFRRKLFRRSDVPIRTVRVQGAADLVVHVIGHRSGHLDRRHPVPRG